MTDLAKEKQTDKLVVAAPYDPETLRAIKLAEDKGLVRATLIGDRDKILSAAEEIDLQLSEDKIIDIKEVNAIARQTVKLVNENKADFVMKGLLGTSTILKAVVNAEYGLKTDQLLSYVAVLDIPSRDKFLIMTDPAMNIDPDLEEKIQITENAITVANALEIKRPKVALLAAVEKVNPKMQVTIDAAALAKMGDREQIKDAVIDGPLAFDNAISEESKKIKGIESEVAGQADIVVVPNIEVGNVLYKSLTCLTETMAGGLVIGATNPVVLSSRADSYLNKFNSILLGKFFVRYQNKKE